MELNSGGGASAAAEMIAYSLLLANKVTKQGTATAVGQESACYSACTFIFAAGRYRMADPSAMFMFHQPHSRPFGAIEPHAPEEDPAKVRDRITGRTLSWVSFRSLELADYLVTKGFYRFRDCFLGASQISEAFPGYLSGVPAPFRTTLSPPLGRVLARTVIDDIEINGCFRGPV